MADLFDYLAWRGDVPFSADPFNEVDGLLLAELAYTEFNDPFPGEHSLPIQEIRESYFRDHSEEEIRQTGAGSARAALFLAEMSEGRRFCRTRLARYIHEIDREKDAQIAAVTYLLEDGTAFVAFRGTDSTLVGWKEDFHLSYLDRTEGQQRAAAYLNTVGRTFDLPLRVGGHSKGGNFAVYAASFCDPSIQERILRVYAYDSPGFRTETLEAEGYARILPRIVSIVPDTSIIGMILSNPSERRVVRSSAFGIAQHDGLTWALCRNRFEEASLSETGQLIEQALGSWLEQMDDQTRESFTNTVFSLFEATGQETFHSMSEQKWKSAEAMISSMAGLPKEKRQELSRLIRKLIASGGQSVATLLPGRKKEN